jgi:rSAM/selenodomain-associated transferase 2
MRHDQSGETKRALASTRAGGESPRPGRGGESPRRHRTPLLSVVIPTLDEEEALAATIRSVRATAPGSEIVVADGGSRDATLDVARSVPGVRTMEAPRGRGPQMNAGAAVAIGEVLLFLHADTHLPPDAGALVASALADPRVVGGSFFLGFDSSHPILWLSSLASRLNVAWATYGDQAFFFRRAVFERLGGFAPVPLFEDVELQARARRLGRCVKIQRPVTTSARRFLRVGVVRQQLRNALLLAAYHLGVPPVRLAEWYEH